MYFMKNSNQLETACRKSLEMLELEFSIYQQSQEYMYKCIHVCNSNLMQDTLIYKEKRGILEVKAGSSMHTVLITKL